MSKPILGRTRKGIEEKKEEMTINVNVNINGELMNTDEIVKVVTDSLSKHISEVLTK